MLLLPHDILCFFSVGHVWTNRILDTGLSNSYTFQHWRLGLRNTRLCVDMGHIDQWMELCDFELLLLPLLLVTFGVRLEISIAG